MTEKEYEREIRNLKNDLECLKANPVIRYEYPRDYELLKKENRELKKKNQKLNSFLQNGHVVTLASMVNDFLKSTQQSLRDIYAEFLVSRFDHESTELIKKVCEALYVYRRELMIFQLDYTDQLIASNPRLELVFKAIDELAEQLGQTELIYSMSNAKQTELYEMLQQINSAINNHLSYNGKPDTGDTNDDEEGNELWREITLATRE